MMIDLSDVRFTRRVCNDVTLHVAEAGPETGRLSFCCTVFRSSGSAGAIRSRRSSLRAFVVVMPDQRGYNLSDKPKGIANYDVDKLSADVVALAAHYTNDAVPSRRS